MFFEIRGPFTIPRTICEDSLRNNRLSKRSKEAVSEFWEMLGNETPGIATACGCYLATVESLPKYVGKASRQTFSGECFHPHKIRHYKSAIKGRRGQVKLFFGVRVTPKGKFSKPSRSKDKSVGHRDVDLLEKLLIGDCLKRGSTLLNIKETVLISKIEVPGFLNTTRGKGRAKAVQQFRNVLFGKSRRRSTGAGGST